MNTRVVIGGLALACLAGAVAASWGVFLQRLDVEPVSVPRVKVLDAAPKPITTYYPYSVVPGGVHSDEEFQRRPDAIARRSYGSIRHVVPAVLLIQDELLYTSYRLNNTVYWSRKPILVHMGEPLLVGSTGPADMAIRQRCGNLLSSSPQKPVAAAHIEPRAKDLGDESPTPEDLDLSNKVLSVVQTPEAETPAWMVPVATRETPVPARQDIAASTPPRLPWNGFYPGGGGGYIGGGGVPVIIVSPEPRPSMLWCVGGSFLLLMFAWKKWVR